MRRSIPFATTCLFLLLATGPAVPQEAAPEGDPAESEETFEGVGHVPKLEIARRTLPNFVEDLTALGSRAAGEEEEQPPLDGVFVIGAESSRHAIIWDPVTCRLLGILDLEAPEPEEAPAPSENAAEEEAEGDEETDAESPEPPSPFLFVAAGSPPLSETSGASGAAAYFGMRLVEGQPEFLYSQGTLLVSERLWLENGGDTLQQHFSFREIDSDLQLRFPEEWLESVESDRGDWDDELLEVEQEEAGELRLTYRIRLPEKETGSSEEGEE